MSTITKQWLQSQISAIKAVGITDSNTLQAFEIALASLEAEAVAIVEPSDYVTAAQLVGEEPRSKAVRPLFEGALAIGQKLYTTPPAPVVDCVPLGDSPYDVTYSMPSNLRELIAEEIGILFSDDDAQSVWNVCRSAAMLQGADGTLTNEGTIPVTQFKPVADLYGLTSPTGGETSFTFDAVEARDFIDGGWLCQEYVELERFQEAVSGNSPVIPDGWVMVPFEPTYQMCKAMGLPWESPRFPDLYKAMLAAVKK
ncbi:TPA: hypothetical protein QCH55_002258 [Enterobacter kobei]|nr:hypothetical protein [Enterobacter kobei]